LSNDGFSLSELQSPRLQVRGAERQRDTAQSGGSLSSAQIVNRVRRPLVETADTTSERSSAGNRGMRNVLRRLALLTRSNSDYPGVDARISTDNDDRPRRAL